MTIDEKTMNAMSVLKRITGKYCSRRFVYSSQFLEIIRNYRFESLTELDKALHAYCHMVLTREVRNAIFVDLPDNAPISALNLQTSIQRGMTQKLTVNEFIGGLDPVTQYRRYIQVTDCFSLNSVGGK
jgi:hypothetical protein